MMDSTVQTRRAAEDAVEDGLNKCDSVCSRQRMQSTAYAMKQSRQGAAPASCA